MNMPAPLMNDPLRRLTDAGPLSEDELQRASVSVLKQHARSFYFASFFLPRSFMRDAAVLYAFCRWIDDVADTNHHPDEARAALDEIKAALLNQNSDRPLLKMILGLLRERNIDVAVPLSLIDGVARDLKPVRIQDDRELKRYCYQVASTVGLMMCGVLRVGDPRARAFAIDLGLAMQLTNICRDVAADARLGRVYLPRERLMAARVEPDDIILWIQAFDANPRALSLRQPIRSEPGGIAVVTLEMLNEADRYYESALNGLCYIPWPARFSILIAAEMYRAIGDELNQRRGSMFHERAFVSKLRKVFLTGRALMKFLSPQILGLSRPVAHDTRLHSDLALKPSSET